MNTGAGMQHAAKEGKSVNTVLVVGASGFVGRAVVPALQRRGLQVRAASRTPLAEWQDVEFQPLPDLTVRGTDWSASLAGVSGVVYLAARVHVMNDQDPDPLGAYRAVNRDAALELAAAAAAAGVRRFVYLSSVKVNGEATTRPLVETDPPHPVDPYGQSKWEAEQALLDLGRRTGLEVVVLRPPLVYGPGVKANFMALARAAGQGLPLPIGAVDNRRSMVYVENLADLIATVLSHPAAAGETFFAVDAEDLSTPALTRHLAQAQGRTPWLPRLPVPILERLGALTGKAPLIHRLTSSLQVSGEKAHRLLGWTPPYPVWQALARTGRALQPAREGGPRRLTARQRLYLTVRGAVERVAALLLLLALLPVWSLTALAIRLDSAGPVLFRQERAGRRHQPFHIYKFRSMRADAPHLSTEEMQRSGLNPVTRVGAFLRRTSLDELPQLLNVIRGEMSFVGPRPALMTQAVVLKLREEAGVDQLLPGITGLAQVRGRDDLDDHTKVQYDAEYLRQAGVAMDLQVVAQTVQSVWHGTGTK